MIRNVAVMSQWEFEKMMRDLEKLNYKDLRDMIEIYEMKSMLVEAMNLPLHDREILLIEKLNRLYFRGAL